MTLQRSSELFASCSTAMVKDGSFAARKNSAVFQRIGPLLAGHLLLVACSVPDRSDQAKVSANVQAGAEASSPQSAEALSRKDQQPMDLVRLSAPEIESRLLGKRISPDQSIEQAAIGFSEDFAADGTWKTNRTERAVVTKTGTWRIRDNRICVTIPGDEEICRDVWLDKRTDSVAMIDAGSSLGNIIIMRSTSLQ